MRALILFLSILILAGCDKPEPKKVPLPSVAQSKELVIVTHYGPNTYYIDGDNQYAGLEYDLAKLFAADLGDDYRIKFVVVDTVSQVIPSLLQGNAHIAAAGLSITPQRQKILKFSIPYQNAQQVVVYRQGKVEPPEDIGDLVGKNIAVPYGTSYSEELETLKRKYPKLEWEEKNNVSTDELLEYVANGIVDYTLADEHIVSMMQNYFPELGQGINVGEPEEIAWAFPKNCDDWLFSKANAFFKRIASDGTLRNLIDRYYGHADRLQAVDINKFLDKSTNVLPKYVDIFKDAQEVTGTDWRLLAAISYQESHWDESNTSPTNVRGMMMLTEDTAKKLGVTDRLDPRQSILAGAKYLNILKEKIPGRIQDPDRTWMALAAYNIGYSHLEDARVLAQRLKLNPDSWADVKLTLPLLNKAKYYSTLRFGYASGGAPVIFVESIRTYKQILEKFEPGHATPLKNFNMAMLDFY